MKDVKGHLILPVENQVREFDAKLLLACMAARRGFSSVIGSRLEVDFRIASFPRSIYLSKSMTARSEKMFRILRMVGHEIAAWDEEALVHPPAEMYFSRRLSSRAISMVSHLFAWGEENAELWRGYSHLPSHTRIHITGNPRGDMLRPEMRTYFDGEAEELRRSLGDFILINTNFSNVNAFYPILNLFLPSEKPGGDRQFARGAVGMSREFAEGLQEYKQAIFEDFKRLIPALEHAFPSLTIVVRPHPVENPRPYHDIAERCRRVKVLNEGNVVPWLRAAKALVHNGCTTGIEAYAMGVPSVAYRATVRDYYDNGFYFLPNALSHQCFSMEDLCTSLNRILSGELGAAGGKERRDLLARYMTAQEGPLACERIVQGIEEVFQDAHGPGPSPLARAQGRFKAAYRRAVKRCKSLVPGSKYRPGFQRHRYPGLSLKDVHEKIERIQKLVGERRDFSVKQLSTHIFLINPPEYEGPS